MENRILRNISIIVAIADNRAIGKENKLLWHIPDDLKRFKRLTTGHTLIMGRNTFLSLPNGTLPNRKHIVITDVADETFDGCEIAHSMDDAIAMTRSSEECFVIGGGMVYAQFLPLAGKLYLTRVHSSFDADTFFPQIDFTQWKVVSSESVEKGENNPYALTYTEYIRI